MVHVTMNYVPPLSLITPFVAPLSAGLEELIERVLRDVKAALEAKVEMPGRKPPDATGTDGPAELSGTQHTRFGGAPNPAAFTRPPEAKS